MLPADDPLAAVWVKRYPYGVPVQSATSLGNKFPSLCAFAPPFCDYFNRVYVGVSAQAEPAAHNARIQFDQVLCWLFLNGSGMDWRFYRGYLSICHDRPAQLIFTSNDGLLVKIHIDPDVSKTSAVEVCTHGLATHPHSKFEIRWPLNDINDPEVCEQRSYDNLSADWASKLTGWI